QSNAASQPHPHRPPLLRPRRARGPPPRRRCRHPTTRHPLRLHHAAPAHHLLVQPPPPPTPPAARRRAFQGPAHRPLHHHGPLQPTQALLGSSIPMEVEIKLRLPDAAAHRRLSSFLAPRLRRTHAQRNLFFDAAARTLAAATAALRVRLYGPDDRAPLRAVLALKRRPRIDAGVSRVEELEDPLDPALALACADDPARLGGVDSPILRLVAAEYGVGGGAAPFVCLGGFRNTRAVYELEDDGLVLELDETRFDFGTSYELECETAEPDRAKEVLERLLTVAGVPYEYSRSNKFACFMAGKLLP
ncbi:hypothetical protein PVAP13_3NG304430, partial [Panicum virgatum]